MEVDPTAYVDATAAARSCAARFGRLLDDGALLVTPVATVAPPDPPTRHGCATR